MVIAYESLRPAEVPFWYVGLVSANPWAPVWRFSAVFAATTALEWAIKPPLMFDRDGEPKLWVYVDNVYERSTYWPWYFLPFVLGAAAGILV